MTEDLLHRLEESELARTRNARAVCELLDALLYSRHGPTADVLERMATTLDELRRELDELHREIGRERTGRTYYGRSLMARHHAKQLRRAIGDALMGDDPPPEQSPPETKPGPSGKLSSTHLRLVPR